MTSTVLSPARTGVWRRIKIAVAIMWNVIGTVVALAAGSAASPAALIGCGVESIVEILRAAAELGAPATEAGKS